MRRLVAEVTGGYRDAGAASDVTALAWFLLSSLAPLAVGLTALASVLLRDYDEAQARVQLSAACSPATFMTRSSL